MDDSCAVRNAEIWKPVVRFEEFYSVSSLGRVARTALGTHTYCGRILKSLKDRKGYCYVDLYGHIGKRRVKIHRMVAEAFIGPIPPGYQINHIDGICCNNAVSNLEIVTCSENVRHALKTGLRKGYLAPHVILAAKQRYDEIKSLTKVAAEFGTCHRTLHKVFRLTDPGFTLYPSAQQEKSNRHSC